MKILAVGDLHGEFGRLNALISKKHPDYVFQCGDFGWWPGLDQVDYRGSNKRFNLKGVKPQGSKVFWCDGNHEDHTSLIQNGCIQELYEGVHFCSRGSLLELPDRTRVLFIGGADSVDKPSRVPGYDWFPEENISVDEAERALSHRHVDIVVSHTSPVVFSPRESLFKKRDPNRFILEEVYLQYKPTLWVCGHWHTYSKQKICGTTFIALDYPGHGDQWWCDVTKELSL